MFLITKRCPHTGVTNFYSDTDPHLAVGFIARRPGKGFTWHCFADGPDLSGLAPDIETAAERLTEFLAPIDDGRAHRRLSS
jgi:hypothetical protein